MPIITKKPKQPPKIDCREMYYLKKKREPDETGNLRFIHIQTKLEITKVTYNSRSLDIGNLEDSRNRRTFVGFDPNGHKFVILTNKTYNSDIYEKLRQNETEWRKSGSKKRPIETMWIKGKFYISHKNKKNLFYTNVSYPDLKDIYLDDKPIC